MPFNGAGSFTPYTPGNPVVAGTTITAATHNQTISDLAAGLTNTMTRDGQAAATANIPMGGFKVIGIGAATVAGDAVRYEQVGALALAQGAAASGANTTITSLASITTISGTPNFTGNATGQTAAASDNDTGLATTAMVQAALKQSGKVLKVQGFTDGGNSTASVSAVVLNSARWSYTPVSTNSTLFLIVTGQCYATSLGSGAGYSYFYIGESTGVDNVVSTGIALQNQQYSTTYAQQTYVPLAIQVKLTNTSLATRLFEIMGQSFNAGVTIGASGALTVIEVAN